MAFFDSSLLSCHFWPSLVYSVEFGRALREKLRKPQNPPMPKLRRDRLRGCRGCDFRTEGNEDNEESAWIELNKTAAAVATALWAVFVMLKDRRNRTATGR